MDREKSGFHPPNAGIAIHFLVEGVDGIETERFRERQVVAVGEVEGWLLHPEVERVYQSVAMVDQECRECQDFQERRCGTNSGHSVSLVDNVDSLEYRRCGTSQ
jgi:hypothetical protein